MQAGETLMTTRSLLGLLVSTSLLAGAVLSGCAGGQRYAQLSTSMAGEVAGSTADAAAPEAPAAEPVPTVARKIIYTLTADLVVQSLGEAETTLTSLVKKYGGYVASTEVTGTPGSPRTGTWKLRIPTGKFDPFRKELDRLGELQNTRLDSQDVTEEYFDVQAQIANKQVEEQRLVEHLRRSTGTLADILSVEKELSRVRGEIDRLQGRLRLLANLTDLTTVTVTLHEVSEFVAPRSASFGAEAARTFHGSLGVMREGARQFALLVIALFPWLVVLGILVLPIVLLARRRRLG